MAHEGYSKSSYILRIANGSNNKIWIESVVGMVVPGMLDKITCSWGYYGSSANSLANQMKILECLNGQDGATIFKVYAGSLEVLYKNGNLRRNL